MIRPETKGKMALLAMVLCTLRSIGGQYKATIGFLENETGLSTGEIKYALQLLIMDDQIVVLQEAVESKEDWWVTKNYISITRKGEIWFHSAPETRNHRAKVQLGYKHTLANKLLIVPELLAA